jgi:hypothetical protein
MDEKIDPELADDRDVQDEDIEEAELPDYDPTPFELTDDFEYEGGDEDGEEDEE